MLKLIIICNLSTLTCWDLFFGKILKYFISEYNSMNYHVLRQLFCYNFELQNCKINTENYVGCFDNYLWICCNLLRFYYESRKLFWRLNIFNLLSYYTLQYSLKFQKPLEHEWKLINWASKQFIIMFLSISITL